MIKKKLAGIIVGCTLAILAVVLLVVFHPWRPAVSTPMYSLIVEISPSGGGSVSLSPSGGDYEACTQVALIATPASGYHFVNWAGDVDTVADVNSASTVISVEGDCSVTANFTLGVAAIRDWYDLDSVRADLGGSYLLVEDLDSNTAGYMELAGEIANGGMGWEPIGTSADGFTGSFDGQGYEIRDLFINRPDQDYVGLFARVSWIHPIENVGCIENVGVVNADVTGHFRVGVLIGDNSGTVNNSYSKCSVASGVYYVGDLVGYNDGGFVVESYSTGNVTGGGRVGGLVGAITGTRNVREGRVTDCYSTSSVTGGSRVGGLVGDVLADVSVSNCYFAGSVAGGRWAGGLVGANGGGNLSNCYSTGAVTGDGYVGGLVGFNYWGTISSCYSTGMVSGDEPVGGMVGENDEGTVSDSLWDRQTSGQATSDGGTGKTTIEMQNISTFTEAGWDMVAVADSDTTNPAYIWSIVDGRTYPFLSWQS